MGLLYIPEEWHDDILLIIYVIKYLFLISFLIIISIK